MQKFNFNIWDNSDSDNYELPLFINTQNLFILDKNNISIIDAIMVDKFTRLDTIIFDKYGGFTNIEQFNVIKKILPLVLLFNDINDISMIQSRIFIKLPEINSLIDNLYIFDENDSTLETSLSFDKKQTENNLPGLNPINKYNVNFKNDNSTNTKTVGIPSIGIELEKVKYDNEKGVIIY